ncbi:MAG: CPBP family intramembrane metalloprotease [Spirochaetaceae bacterium]|nr:MAG: CPBP family intramembrane metalloprotease [Spirochaetaceae bacterium]
MRRPLVWATLFEFFLAVVALAVGAVFRFSPLAGLPDSAGGAVFSMTTGAAIFLGVSAAMPPLLLFFIFLRSDRPPFRRIRAILRRVLEPLLRSLTPLGAGVLSLAAGVGEEVLFRGLVMGAILLWLGPLPAVLASSLLFGALHWVTPAYAAYATLLGLYLGGLYILTGTLLVPIIVHAIYDAVALVLLASREGYLSDYGKK